MPVTINPLGPPFDFTGATGSGSGDVTHTGTLTAHEVILGNGGADIKALGSVGSLGQVLTSGGAGVDPSWQPGGSGTIGGTIAATQVAFGTGADTIGGSANFTWDGTTVNFTSAHGLSFDGAAAPITVLAGSDGGDTAIFVDNIPDGYIVLQFNQLTDIYGVGGLGLGDNAGTSFSFDTGGNAFATAATVFSASAPTVQLNGFTVITPNTTRTGEARISTDIFAGSTELNVMHIEQFADIDTGTTKFESSIILGATNATQTEKPITAFGAEGHYTALNVLTNYEMFWYDHVRDGSILRIDSVTDATTLQVGADYRVAVVREVASQTAFTLNADGVALRTDTTTAHTGLIQAYDVDNTTYRTFATLTNGNTPTFVVTPPSGGTVTLNATTLQQAGSTITLGGAFTMSGAFAFTGTVTGTTTVTFPTSGTLLTTAGSGASLTFPGTLSIASAKVLTSSNTLTFTGTDGITVAFGAGLSITAGKSLSVSNILTFTGTDSSSVAFGAGGTVQYTGVTKRVSIVGWEALPDTSGNVWLEPASLTQTNDRYPQMVIRFKDTSTKDGIGFRFQVPFDYVGAGKFYVNWTTTATTGNAIWDLDYSSASQTSSLDPSADEEALTVTTAAPASSQLGVVSSMTATAADLAAGDICQGKLSRDGASADTIAADLIAYEVYFEYVN